MGGGAVLTVILASAAPANAIIFQTFTDRTDWVNALTATPSLEDFNSFASDTSFGGSSITAGSLTLSSNANSSSEARIDVIPYGSSATGIDGTPMLRASGLDTGENITVGLPSAFSGFGFDYENHDGGSDALIVSIDSENVITLPGSSGTKGFVGIIATDGSFSDVVFQGGGSNGGIFNAIDNVEWGNAASTPVPFEASPTLGLLAVGGIFGVNYLRKRRAAINKLS